MSTALFIGRFQPFHNGHLSVVQQALNEIDFLIIGIGSAEENFLPANPYTASERWEMIVAALDEVKIPRDRYVVLPVRNINNYAIWVEHVSKLVPSFQSVYTGSPIVKKLFEDHGKYEVHEAKIEVQVNATTVREYLLKNENWESLVPPAVALYLKKNDRDKRLALVA